MKKLTILSLFALPAFLSVASFNATSSTIMTPTVYRENADAVTQHTQLDINSASKIAVTHVSARNGNGKGSNSGSNSNGGNGGNGGKGNNASGGNGGNGGNGGHNSHGNNNGNGSANGNGTGNGNGSHNSNHGKTGK